MVRAGRRRRHADREAGNQNVSHDQLADGIPPGFIMSVCVQITSSTSCDQAIFVDQATGASLPSDTVLAEIDRFA